MKKLKLQLDELAVETFATAAKADETGTVEANVRPTRYVSCYLTACPLDCTGGLHSDCCTAGTDCCTHEITCAYVGCEPSVDMSDCTGCGCG